ncbi:MAG: hypothetical protein ACI8UO_006298 [Verrucomicrobiales bacterium]|jgi:hypothetical protein
MNTMRDAVVRVKDHTEPVLPQKRGIRTVTQNSGLFLAFNNVAISLLRKLRIVRRS